MTRPFPPVTLPDPTGGINGIPCGLYIDWENDGLFSGSYDDVSNDLRSLSVQLGRSATDISHPTARPSTMSATLRNIDGLYSPDDVDGPLFGKLLANRACAVRFGDGNGGFYTRFTGWTEQPTISADSNGIPIVTITANGALEQINRKRLLPRKIGGITGITMLTDLLQVIAQWPDALTVLSEAGFLVAGVFQDEAPKTIADLIKMIQALDPLSWFYDGYDWSIFFESGEDRTTPTGMKGSRTTSVQATFTDVAPAEDEIYASINRLNMKSTVVNQVIGYLLPEVEGAEPQMVTFDEPQSQDDYGLFTVELAKELPTVISWLQYTAGNYFGRFATPPVGLIITSPSGRSNELAAAGLALELSDRIVIVGDAATRLGLTSTTDPLYDGRIPTVNRNEFYVEGLRYNWTDGEILRMEIEVSQVWDGLPLFGLTTFEDPPDGVPEPTSSDDVGCLYPCTIIEPFEPLPEPPVGGSGIASFTVQHSGLSADAANLRYQEANVWLPTTQHPSGGLLFTDTPPASELAGTSGGDTIYTNTVMVARLDTSSLGTSLADTVLTVAIYSALNGDASSKALNVYIADHFTWPPADADDAYVNPPPGTMALVGTITDWDAATDPDPSGAVAYPFDISPSLVNPDGDTLIYITFDDSPAPSPPSGNAHIIGVAIGAQLTITGTHVP